MTIEELMQNQDFMTRLAAAASDEEVVKLYAEEGITITAEEIAEAKKAAEGELNEDALDEVAGGMMVLHLPKLPKGPLPPNPKDLWKILIPKILKK